MKAHSVPSIILAVMMAAALLAGCVTVNIEMPAKATLTATVTADPADSLPPTPPPTPLPTEPLSATPTPDLTLVPPPEGAPRALYFLAQGGVWVLRPNASLSERLTPPDSLVTAFDVWPDDGRIAYGTKSGKLYIVMPGEDPRLLVKPGGDDAPYPEIITGVAWSPDGERMAYTVDFDGSGETVTAPYPIKPSGVWTIPLRGGSPTWLISNRYFASLDGRSDDVNKLRSFSNPRWSPDGNGLLLHASAWEWGNEQWLYPLEFAEDDRNLHSIPTYREGFNAWNNAVWMPDSQGLLYSGQLQALHSDLVWVSRDGTQYDVWTDGEQANMYIYDARMVPEDSFLPGATAGIASGPGRMVYLASCPMCTGATQTRLWEMRTKLVDPYQNGGVLEPEMLCSLKDSFGNPNYPRHIEWRPDFSSGVLTCGSNEIYLLSLRNMTPIETNLIPSLPALGDVEVPEFRWGEIVH